MPYINEELKNRELPSGICIRAAIDEMIEEVKDTFKEKERDGVAHYIIARLGVGILKPESINMSYAERSRITTLFNNANLECYRRILAGYEDNGISKNGDIPEYENV